MLTVELGKDKDTIEIHGDREGMELLSKIIGFVMENTDHYHLNTSMGRA